MQCHKPQMYFYARPLLLSLVASLFLGGCAVIPSTLKPTEERFYAMPIREGWMVEVDTGIRKLTQYIKTGYVNEKGTVITQPEFDGGQDSAEGLAGVKVGDYWGFMDKTGEIVIEFDFSYVCPFSEGLAYVIQEGKAGFINRKGEFVIQPKFYVPERKEQWDEFSCENTSFHQGRAAVVDSKSKYELVYWQAVIDTAGNYIVKPGQYISFGTSTNRYRDGVIRLLHFRLNQLFDERFESIEKPTSSFYMLNIASSIIEDVLDSEGKVIPNLSGFTGSIKNFSEGLAAQRINNQWQYIDTKGNVVFQLSPDIREARPFSDGVAAISQYNKQYKLVWSFIDPKGKVILDDSMTKERITPAPFSEGLSYSDSNCARYFNNKTVRFIDKTGKVALKIPCSKEIKNPKSPVDTKFDASQFYKFNKASRFEDGLAVISYTLNKNYRTKLKVNNFSFYIDIPYTLTKRQLISKTGKVIADSEVIFKQYKDQYANP